MTAHFAKEREDLRHFSGAERDFMAKQAIASAEANAQLENIAQQQVQHQVTEKALSGVNADMWASYMQSFSQTEAVQSTETFKYDKESGFYLDAKAALYYDPNTTYFFTTDYKKYFVYDHEVQMLCHVDAEGKKVEDGEKRPLPSQDISAGSRARRPRSRSRSRSRRRARSRSHGPSTPARGPGPERTVHQRREQRSRSRGPASSSRGVNQQRPAREAVTPDGAGSKNGDFKPIHFPGGDPLARFAPAEAAPKPEAKKKRRPTGESILGLASTPVSSIARPGRVTVLSSAPQPGPIQIPTQFSPSLPSPRASMSAPAAFASTSPPTVTLEPGEVICEVCMRKFSSEEMLRKHEKLSDLHKQNLAKLNGDV